MCAKKCQQYFSSNKEFSLQQSGELLRVWAIFRDNTYSPRDIWPGYNNAYSKLPTVDLALQLCLLHPLFLVHYLDQLESPLALIHISAAVLECTASAESLQEPTWLHEISKSSVPTSGYQQFCLEEESIKHVIVNTLKGIITTSYRFTYHLSQWFLNELWKGYYKAYLML